jgi:hypothetical protein
MFDKAARGALRFFRSKNIKYGAVSVVMTAAAIAVAVAANLLAGLTDAKIDLTPNRLFTIGGVTEELLAGLDRPVEIIGLFDDLQVSAADQQIGDALKMLENYAKYPNVSLRYVDPDKNPSLIHELDPDGTLGLERSNFVVRCGGKAKKLALSDLFVFEYDQQSYQQQLVGMKAEEAFTGAIQYVAADYTPTVYFAGGHGEMPTAQFTQLTAYLENNNYLVGELDLNASGGVPGDAELLVFASPTSDLFPNELDSLRDYFQGGGNAMFMFDCDDSGRELRNFNILFEAFNVAINSDKVRSDDERRHLANDPYFVIYDFGESDVVPASGMTALSASRSVSVLNNAKEWIKATRLLSTTEDSAAVSVAEAGREAPGPLDIAVAVENGGGEGVSKIVVTGNASFVSDDYAPLYSQLGVYSTNMRLFLYSLQWMLGERDALVIQPKTFETPVLSISASQVGMIGIGLVVALPLLIMGAGLAVYLRRRHL